MYSRTIAVLFIAVVLCAAAADACNDSFCWLADPKTPRGRAIVKGRCNGRIKSCSRSGKSGFTCACGGGGGGGGGSGADPYADLKCDKPYISPTKHTKKYYSMSVQMNSATGAFDFYWGTYNLADKVTIYQAGYKIFSSDVPVTGSGISKVDLNGKSSKIRVVVNAPQPGSLFDFYAGCTKDYVR